ncbi:hypothetical protein K7W42_03155 [Deinococcus sp. HMF7604]|uniref:hypothetical protein n=1 Tax=Deinococcus betulae TaxID=2873312 RepID=UPI001CCE8256|nr:hypothetical protein [Deinococcus betulae]MBZ9749856.1 hypothetical protein [Deinococcus betulae]
MWLSGFRFLCLGTLLSCWAHGAGLAGADHDGNGIRDDVDAYIAEHTPAASPERQAVQDYARSLQRLVTGQPPQVSLDSSPVLSLVRSGNKNWAEWTREVRSRTVNTGARLDAYAAAVQKAGPQFLPLYPISEDDCASGQCTLVIFQNGILTTEETALKSMLALRRLLGETAGPQRLLYALNYNPTEGLLDLVEVFRQKFGEHDLGAALFAGTYGEPAALSAVATSLLEAKLRAQTTDQLPTTVGGWMTALTNPGSLLPKARPVLPTVDEVADMTRQYVEAYLGSLVQTTLRLKDRAANSTYMDDNARQLTDGVEAYLRRGLRVVLVAHSQGNLYAEVVNRELERRGVPTQHFAVAGIAVPNGHSPANGPYVSTQADLVIGALRLIFPVLAANDHTVPAAQPGSAFLGHAFVDVYTSPGSAVSKRVADVVLQAIDQVSRP